MLENVSGAVEAPEDFEVLVSVPIAKLEYNICGTCYVAVAMPDSIVASTGSSLTSKENFKMLISICR